MAIICYMRVYPAYTHTKRTIGIFKTAISKLSKQVPEDMMCQNLNQKKTAYTAVNIIDVAFVRNRKLKR